MEMGEVKAKDSGGVIGGGITHVDRGHGQER